MIIKKIYKIIKLNNEIKNLKNGIFTKKQQKLKNDILQDFYKKNHITEFITETKTIIKNV